MSIRRGQPLSDHEEEGKAHLERAQKHACRNMLDSLGVTHAFPGRGLERADCGALQADRLGSEAMAVHGREYRVTCRTAMEDSVAVVRAKRVKSPRNLYGSSSQVAIV